jgi:glycosyltransferase involved in cell wall biosynthesis
MLEMNKPRVVIVSGSYPEISCGVAGHTALIAQATAHLGRFDVAVLTSADPAVKISPGLPYRVLPRITSWGVLNAQTICDEILALEPNVVHLQNPTVKYAGWRSVVMSRVGPLLKRRAPSVRLVVMQHDVALSRPIFRRRFRPLLRSADAVTVSNSRDHQAVLALGVEPHKIYRTPVSSHFSIPRSTRLNQADLRQKLRIPPKSIATAYFGYVHPARNVDVLIEALGLLMRRGHDVFGLILGGPSHGAGRYYDRCRRLADKLGLDQRILWTGYASGRQIAEGLAAADVFVSLPQRGADLRNTSIIAGLLAELPIITTLNPRFYTDDDLKRLGCFYVPSGDPNTLAQTILQAAVNPTPPDFRARIADFLDPDKIWSRHVEINHLAYEGLPPLPPVRFEG